MTIRVAAILTCFRHRSHANVILENFLEPYLFCGRRVDPRKEFRVVSMYVDQFPKVDMARGVARDYGITIYPTIAKALCGGGKKLAVDAVLSIGEHGDYPVNELGQKMYPRKRFFDAAVSVMKQANRFVPLFNDKHYSYRWDWAREMVDVARANRMPLMGGSSVPLAQRRPRLGLPRGTRITEAISIHGGPLESYDFHGLELLESMIESRKGGETGVASVEFLAGEDVWTAAKQGRWSIDLAHEAMKAELGKPLEDLKLGLAAAAAQDAQVDAGNACALGASYGGYMMNWVAGQWLDGFKCLVQHDGVFDARAMAYETEELWFDEWEHGGPYFEVPQEFEKWNPVNHVAQWKTPMLVVTGEKDFRIPYTQGLAAFTALQRRDIPSKLLVFPDENHWVLKPKNSLQWYGEALGWLDKWTAK